jgi:hypothetical protein
MDSPSLFPAVIGGVKAREVQGFKEIGKENEQAV